MSVFDLVFSTGFWFAEDADFQISKQSSEFALELSGRLPKCPGRNDFSAEFWQLSNKHPEKTWKNFCKKISVTWKDISLWIFQSLKKARTTRVGETMTSQCRTWSFVECVALFLFDHGSCLEMPLSEALHVCVRSCTCVLAKWACSTSNVYPHINFYLPLAPFWLEYPYFCNCAPVQFLLQCSNLAMSKPSFFLQRCRFLQTRETELREWGEVAKIWKG